MEELLSTGLKTKFKYLRTTLTPTLEGPRPLAYTSIRAVSNVLALHTGQLQQIKRLDGCESGLHGRVFSVWMINRTILLVSVCGEFGKRAKY